MSNKNIFRYGGVYYDEHVEDENYELNEILSPHEKKKQQKIIIFSTG